MSELPPSFTQGGCTTAQADRQVQSSLVCSEGVASGVGGSLEVTQRGAGANMSVDVASGNAFIQGTQDGWQGMYHVSADAIENLVIGANGTADPRIDIVIAEVRDDAYGGGGFNDWRLRVVPGTPNPVPSPPATPDNSLVLAQVTVAAGETSITNAEIEDTRVFWHTCNETPSMVKFTASGAFVKADYPGLRGIRGRVVAGGGGGGGARAADPSVGGGGGGGGYVEFWLDVSALADSETVTVGAGGAGGGGAATGATGGTSSFGSHAVAAGGVGGTEDNVFGGSGGAGGLPTTVPTDGVGTKGGAGEDSFFIVSEGLIHSGGGGATPLGQGATGTIQTNSGGSGRNAPDYGGGGGGAFAILTSGPFAGGTGGDGIVLVELFY